MFLRVISEILEIFTPGSSNYRLHPLLILASISATSIKLFFANPVELLVLFTCIAIVLFLIRNIRTLMKSLIFSLIFISPYILSALIIQWFANILDTYLILTNCARMILLILLSIISLSIMDVVWMIRVFSKLFPNLSISLALALKLIYITSINAKSVLELYNVNLGKLSSVRKVFLTTRATTYLSFNAMLSFAEAFYTRKHLILGERK